MAFLTNLFPNINKKEKGVRVKNRKQKVTNTFLSSIFKSHFAN